jgi:uncharacterized protein with LGFP repeats
MLLDGEIYKKYKALNRWEGPLGLPTAGVQLTPANASDKGVFATFQNGVIWHTPTVGAVALWGRMLKLYAAIDYERSWLGYPTTSCDPTRTDTQQVLKFQGGSIDAAVCGSYFTLEGVPLLQNGLRPAAGKLPPCY